MITYIYIYIYALRVRSPGDFQPRFRDYFLTSESARCSLTMSYFVVG